jgi:DNA-binding NtrC family response regulator
MKRVLVIDADATAMLALGVDCLERGIGVRMVETVCEAVRGLVGESVSLIVVDAGLLRLRPWTHAAVFEHVAPGVPVTVVASPTLPLESRVDFELAGFRVITRPITADDILEKVETP